MVGWTVIGQRGCWYVVSRGYIPATKGNIGRGTIIGWAHHSRASARLAARAMNYKKAAA